MKRDFLESLGIESEVIDKIMKENGKDIEGAKAKFADYDDLKQQLETANATLEKFKDYDQTKADVEKYKTELKKSQEESAAKIAAMERSGKVKDYLSGKKFVNKITQDAITAKMCEALGADESKGKNLDDIFAEITKEQSDILKDENAPTPPVVAPMGGTKSDEDGVMAAFKRMNPEIKID
jgi:hypothetical protein